MRPVRVLVSSLLVAMLVGGGSAAYGGEDDGAGGLVGSLVKNLTGTQESEPTPESTPTGQEQSVGTPTTTTPDPTSAGGGTSEPAPDVAAAATLDVTIETRAESVEQLGETIYDEAFIRAPEGGPPITGTVTFSFWLDDVGTCAGNPMYVGDPQPVTQLEDFAYASSGEVPTSTQWQTGSYFWKAEYSGDANYKPRVHPCGEPNEFTTLYEPNDELLMLTESSDQEVAVGEATFASASFDKPTAQDPDPTGSVTFRLYGPDDGDCQGPVISTSTNPIEAIEGHRAASDTFTPTHPGFYRWVASYSGDSNYDPIVHGCHEHTARAFFNAVGDPIDDDGDGDGDGDEDGEGDGDGDGESDEDSDESDEDSKGGLPDTGAPQSNPLALGLTLAFIGSLLIVRPGGLRRLPTRN
jgi:hypothetical protein